MQQVSSAAGMQVYEPLLPLLTLQGTSERQQCILCTCNVRIDAPRTFVCRRVALNLIQSGRQHYMEAWNSPLSEAAVLGFEYGFSLGCRVTSFCLSRRPMTAVARFCCQQRGRVVAGSV